MIFVTVGTHEQAFNRLLKKIDELIQTNQISDDVVVQHGYSDYKMQNAFSKSLMGSDEFKNYLECCDLLICHGGASTYLEALKNNKKVVIVPRLAKFDEHVNDHQLWYIKEVSDQYKLNYVEDIDDLMSVINKVLNQETVQFNSNNDYFCAKLSVLIDAIVNGGKINE